MDNLNKLLQEKWKVRFDDFEYIEPFLDWIKSNDDVANIKTQPQKEAVNYPKKKQRRRSQKNNIYP